MSRISQSVFSQVTIIIIPFLAVLFQIVDRSAGDTLGSHIGNLNSSLTVYSVILVTSLTIQGYFLLPLQE